MSFAGGDTLTEAVVMESQAQPVVASGKNSIIFPVFLSDTFVDLLSQ